jgi:stress-induced morphogen
MAEKVTQQSLEQKIKNLFSPMHLQVVDTSGGCGQSFDVLIVSEAFKGKGLLERHKMVNNGLKDEISSMHAFSQKTLSPEQWKKD